MAGDACGNVTPVAGTLLDALWRPGRDAGLRARVSPAVAQWETRPTIVSPHHRGRSGWFVLVREQPGGGEGRVRVRLEDLQRVLQTAHR